ncbi:uncharacterized protein [Macrobrachium rosenbergii]|uniref:uncharacterized protein n=1 Tax=Macrobrachium rosenbergii TaxID=79674 RepID=UPI0034D5BFC2
MFSLLTSSMGPRNFYVARNKFFPLYAAGIVPSGAPYRESFNKALHKVVELGLFMKWKEDYYRRARSKATGLKNVDKESNQRVITLAHLQAAFYIIGFGYLTSSIILIGELMLASRKKIFLC